MPESQPSAAPQAAAPARTLLAFDYGRQRIGVAVGQEITRTATALTTLPSVQGRPDWAALDALLAQWRPAALVIGIPYHMDGTAHAVTAAARGFGQQLHDRYQLPVYETDERLSSQAAREAGAGARAAGRRSKLRREELDAFAAKVILERWLESTTDAP